MHSVQRDLAIGGAIGAMTLALAMAWGSPFVTTSSAHAQEQAPQPQQQQPQPQPQPQPDQSQPQQQQPGPHQAQAATFTGTIVKSGKAFTLRDSSGQVYKLDDPDRAKPYVGKTVTVTGELDEQAMVIHVESIQGTSA